jgi:hypothetical protein
MTKMPQTSIQLSQPSQSLSPKAKILLFDKLIDSICVKHKLQRHAILLCVPQKVRPKILFAKRTVDKLPLPTNFVLDGKVVIGKKTNDVLEALSEEDIFLCKESGFPFSVPEILNTSLTKERSMFLSAKTSKDFDYDDSDDE